MGRLGKASTSAGPAFGRSPGDAVNLPIAVLVLCAALLLGPATASAAGPPLIEAVWVEGVNSSAANLNAKIDPNGFETTYRFEYITDAAYQANLAAKQEGFAGASRVPPNGEAIGSSSPQKVSKPLSNLGSLTTYHYRVVATNSAGVTKLPELEFTTEQSGVGFRLPDNRRWELVSPLDKGGGGIAAPEELFGGGDIQAAAAGGAITYGSGTAFGSAPGAPPVSQYVSSRTPAGWVTANISAPLDSGAYGDEPDGAPYRVFSADLSRALLFGGLPCRGGLEGCPAPNPPLPGSGAPDGYMAYYLRDNAQGTLSSLLGAAEVAKSSVSPEFFEVAFAAASPDLAHVVLSSCAKLTADAVEVPGGPQRCDPKAQNLYAWSAGGLKSINLLPGATVGTPTAAIAAPIGAVSTDGARIYWTDGKDLYLREGSQTVQVDEALAGGGVFQTATPDGAIAFFTRAGHLYRFVAATKTATDLTPSGGVAGVLGASADGSYVYYQDATGLELWHGGVTTTVAPGADAAAASNYPPATATARISADGTHLVFVSSAKLTSYVPLDADTGLPDAELYLYGPPPGGGPATLICVSCNPTGERPQGPASIPGALVNGSTTAYRPRALSADSSRVFFDSADDLVVHDTNSRPDVYQWEKLGSGDCLRSPGCISLISSGDSPTGATFLDASADGSDVFFITDRSLVGADPPGSIDVYDARVGGGFPEAEKPIACIGDACQPLPGEPDDPTPGTLTPSSGNPPLRVFEQKTRKQKKKKRQRKKHRRKHGKIARAVARPGR